MNISDLILMFCVMNGPNPECPKELNACVNAKYAVAIDAYAKDSKAKKVSETDMITKAPQQPITDFAFECMSERKKK